ncbi:MAG: hypothetical protein ABR969_06235 [Sedimentisphaerales bacterium]
MQLYHRSSAICSRSHMNRCLDEGGTEITFMPVVSRVEPPVVSEPVLLALSDSS